MVRIALLVSLLLALPCRWCSASTSADAEMNVLFIAVDDLRCELGCYGNTPAQTPQIDRLAVRGTLFQQAYCQQAVCNPSRASLLTGLSPDTLAVWDLPTHFRSRHPNLITLPQLFKHNGYLTQNIGKVFHNYRQDEYQGDAPSWSFPATLHYNTHYNDKPLVEGDLPANFATLEKTECRDVADEAYFDGRVAQQAITALGDLKDKRFFLAVGFWKPHLPFNAPKKYWDLYNRQEIELPLHRAPPQHCPPIALTNYRMNGDKELSDEQVLEARHGHLAAISYLDAQVGKVIAELDRLDLSEKTIIVFWSDHGLHVGERGLWGKRTNFELDTRVPLIISTPSHRPGQQTSGLVELIDIYPTLIDLCGLPAPHKLAGVSLRPLLDAPNTTIKNVALSQHPRPNALKEKNNLEKSPEIMGYSIRTNRFRYTEWQDFDSGKVHARELYDHQNDPDETINLVEDDSHANQLPKLAQLLEDVVRSRRP